MSLRSDIRDAIDEIATPAPWLEDKVESFVLRDHTRRARRRSLTIWGWNASRRQTIGLIAAAMVVVLMATLVIGGRLWLDLSDGRQSEASSINQSELRGLESRPMVLRQLEPGAACPFSPNIVQSGLSGDVFGNGPVYMFNSWNVFTTDRVDWEAFEFYYLAQRPGLVLVRAKDLRTDQPFVFAQYPLAIGAIAAGPVLGTDQPFGETTQLHPEAVLQDPWHVHPANQRLIVMFAIPRATLCWGLQFDGPGGFTETIVWGWDSLGSKGP